LYVSPIPPIPTGPETFLFKGLVLEIASYPPVAIRAISWVMAKRKVPMPAFSDKRPWGRLVSLKSPTAVQFRRLKSGPLDSFSVRVRVVVSSGPCNPGMAGKLRVPAGSVK